jgi:guanylate kinase
MNKKGKLFVISAPSGTGKTTLCNKLLEDYSSLYYSISYTTRKPRKDEQDGIDYFFIDEDTFKSMIDEGKFLEWAIVHNHYYGTAKDYIYESLAEGKNLILDIDPQGARQLKNKIKDAIFVFVIAPSIKDLEQRLRNRRTESEEMLHLRLENAKKEVKLFNEYDYIIVNKDFGKAYKELESIYIAEHLRAKDVNDITELMKLEE